MLEGGSGLAVPGEYIIDDAVPMPVEGPIDAGLSTATERIPTTEIDNATILASSSPPSLLKRNP